MTLLSVLFFNACSGSATWHQIQPSNQHFKNEVSRLNVSLSSRVLYKAQGTFPSWKKGLKPHSRHNPYFARLLGRYIPRNGGSVYLFAAAYSNIPQKSSFRGSPSKDFLYSGPDIFCLIYKQPLNTPLQYFLVSDVNMNPSFGQVY